MAHTDPSTGSKRSQDKKMEASRERCGKKLVDILVTGEITARKASAYNSTRMVTNTRVCGLWTKSTVKVPTGVTKTKN